jgi:uncharacterized membrane protein
MLLRKIKKFILSIKIDTLLLSLILLMMFGEYSQRYTSGWNLEIMFIISPILYVVCNILAIIVIVLIIIYLVTLIVDKIRNKNV